MREPNDTLSGQNGDVSPEAVENRDQGSAEPSPAEKVRERLQQIGIVESDVSIAIDWARAK